jgi:hypothetical protein
VEESKPDRLTPGITGATEIAKMFCWKTRFCAAYALIGFTAVSWSTARAGEADQVTPVKYSSPKAVFDAYREALGKQEWRTVYFCCTPELQKSAVFEAYFASQDRARTNAIEDVLKKFLIDSTSQEAAKLPDKAEYAQVAEFLYQHVSDPVAFFTEMNTVLHDAGHPPELPGGLHDLAVSGDTATAHATIAIRGIKGEPGKPDRPFAHPAESSFHFRKLNGGWLIDTPRIPDPPAPLSVSDRAQQLQTEVDSIWVYLCCSSRAITPTEESNKAKTAQPLAEKNYGELRMSVRPFVYQSPGPTVHLVRLTRAQAKKLIEYLTTEGFLQQAVEPAKQNVPKRDLSENCYTLQVSTQNLQLHEDFGWGPGMLKRLDGLRAALDGEAARAMDAILAGLADERKENGVNR